MEPGPGPEFKVHGEVLGLDRQEAIQWYVAQGYHYSDYSPQDWADELAATQRLRNGLMDKAMRHVPHPTGYCALNSLPLTVQHLNRP
jgi:hypothetical protein